jgi:hypothetical protein
MAATARTTIYVGYADDAEETAAKTLIRTYMGQAEIEGYTIYSAEGWWKGERERAVIIEVIGDSADIDFGIGEVASRLRRNELLEQESVYIVTELVDLVVL